MAEFEVDDWETRDDVDDLGLSGLGLGPKKLTTHGDKWDGEDEEDEVKENWEDDEDTGDKKKVKADKTGPKADTGHVPVVKSNKKKLKKLLKKLDGKAAEKTPEEVSAQKLREEKLREEAELQSVKEAFGSSAISDVDPVTKDDFDALRKRLIKNLTPLEKRVDYQDFVEELIQDLVSVLPTKRMKEVKITLDALYFEKSKIEKAAMGKGHGNTKAQLHYDTARSILKPMENTYDEYEDFM